MFDCDFFIDSEADPGSMLASFRKKVHSIPARGDFISFPSVVEFAAHEFVVKKVHHVVTDAGRGSDGHLVQVILAFAK